MSDSEQSNNSMSIDNAIEEDNNSNSTEETVKVEKEEVLNEKVDREKIIADRKRKLSKLMDTAIIATKYKKQTRVVGSKYLCLVVEKSRAYHGKNPKKPVRIQYTSVLPIAKSNSKTKKYEYGPSNVVIGYNYYDPEKYYKKTFLKDEDFDAEGKFIKQTEPLIFETGEAFKIRVMNSKARRDMKRGDIIEVYNLQYGFNPANQVKHGWNPEINDVDTNIVLREAGDPTATISASYTFPEHMDFRKIKESLKQLSLEPNTYLKEFTAMKYPEREIIPAVYNEETGLEETPEIKVPFNPFDLDPKLLYAKDFPNQFAVFQVANGKRVDDNDDYLHKVKAIPIFDKNCYLNDSDENTPPGTDLRILKCVSSPVDFFSSSLSGKSLFYRVSAGFFNKKKGAEPNVTLEEIPIVGNKAWGLVMPQIFRQCQGILTVRYNVNKTLNASADTTEFAGSACGDGSLLPDWEATFNDAGIKVNREFAIKSLAKFQNPRYTDKDLEVMNIDNEALETRVNNPNTLLFREPPTKNDVECLFLNEYAGRLPMDKEEESMYDFYMVPSYDAVKHEDPNYEEKYCFRERNAKENFNLESNCEEAEKYMDRSQNGGFFFMIKRKF